MDVTRLRAVSKDLFGNKYRIEVASAIHALAGEPFTAMSMHHDTGIGYQRVYEEVGRLADARLLRQVEGQGQGVFYKAVPSSYWESCARALDEFAG